MGQDDNMHVALVHPRFSTFFADHLHRTTLNVQYAGDGALNYEGVTSEESTAQTKVVNFVTAMMLCSGSYPVPYASFVTVPEERRICHSNRMRAFGNVGMASAESSPDTGQVREVYSVIVGEVGRNGRFAVAVKYFHQSHNQEVDSGVRYLGLMMALESLFASGESVSHQVSERVAFFLHDSPGDREDAYFMMKEHYGHRSTIAHGRTPSGSRQELQLSYLDLIQTVRACLLKIARDTSLQAVFTAKDQPYAAAMRHLIFFGNAELPQQSA